MAEIPRLARIDLLAAPSTDHSDPPAPVTPAVSATAPITAFDEADELYVQCVARGDASWFLGADERHLYELAGRDVVGRQGSRRRTAALRE